MIIFVTNNLVILQFIIADTMPKLCFYVLVCVQWYSASSVPSFYFTTISFTVFHNVVFWGGGGGLFGL